MPKEIEKLLNSLEDKTIRSEFLDLIINIYEKLLIEAQSDAEKLILYIMLNILNEYCDLCKEI